jgi:transporter family protein
MIVADGLRHDRAALSRWADFCFQIQFGLARYRSMLVHSWLFWALLSATFAALVSIFAKLSLQKIDPDLAQFLRTAVVLFGVAVPVALSGKWSGAAHWSGRTWLFLVLSGLATSASWICYFRALDVGDATRVAAIDKLSVAMVAIAAALFLQERLGLLGWCGVALVTVGLIMIGHTK